MLYLGYKINDKAKDNIGFRKEQPSPKKNSIIKDVNESHLLTIAPTGAGKGRSNIITTCLTYKGSLIVLDVKGEAARVTARARKKFGKVFIVDPFKKVTKNPAKFNPLDIPMDPSIVEQTGIMIGSAFQPEGATLGDEPFWDHMAFDLLSALCIHSLTTDKKFSEMRKLLYDSDVAYALAVLLDSKKITSKLSCELISAFLQTPDITRGGILSVAHQYVGILGDPVLLENLDGPTSFDVNALIAGEPMTIYLVVPPNKLSAYSSLIRLWFTTLLHLFSERKVRPKIPTLLIIDECANLGKLDGLISAITLMRCYGIRIWTMFQSLGQMKNVYKNDWMTIIDNCDIIQVYGFKHYLTAKDMSEVIGGMTPAQILKIPREDAVLMRAGHPVEIVKKLDYLKDSFFKNKEFDKNPFYQFSRI